MELLGELLDGEWPLELFCGWLEGERLLKLLGERLVGGRAGKPLVPLLKSGTRDGGWPHDGLKG